ncbi:Fructose-1,6-bisphosphatase [Morus notabilis]|uniref:fructose-bisphosphatase n=1 Tax=Morus notabilis TaxID=981085 RepID=W9S5L8_9ROSA|nr:fructose-1,6-bisphosphatase, chloroplastic [Morus notabilis]EXB89981.1 Fructose-1,6-bisphosphatase [Morus notabilis]
MVRTITSSSSHLLFSASLCSNSRLCPLHLRRYQPRTSARSGAARLRAVSSAETQTAKSKIRGKEKEKEQYFQVQNLTTWLLRQEQSGQIDAELTIVLSSISLACKQIASLLQRSSITNLTGAHGTINVQGEDQKKLDVISNELFCSCLRSSGRTGIIASEEEDIPVAVEETYSGNYIVVFDPIDGSANIDTALTTGSIFGIYGPDKQCLVDLDDDTMLDQAAERCVVSVCQPGSNLLAAGYCLYSSAIVFTLSIGKGVFAFTLDPTYGEFVLTHENIQIPKTGKIYSFNEGNYDLWDDKLKNYLDHLRQPGADGKPYSGRYIGCLVGEIHRTLLRGGIYGNPNNKKSKNGNLRLLYECAPMSYLVEQAGGKATDGRQGILEITPTEVHQRTPIFIGSPEEVDKLQKYLA